MKSTVIFVYHEVDSSKREISSFITLPGHFSGGGMKNFLIRYHLFWFIARANNLFQCLRLCTQFISKFSAPPSTTPKRLGVNSEPSLILVRKNFGCLTRLEICTPGIVSVILILNLIETENRIQNR